MKIKSLFFFVALLVTLSANLVAQTQPQVFNVSVYEGIYPDIINAYGQNTTGATNHWVNFGLPGGRRASIIFDPVYYLQHNSDLAAAFGITGYAAALQHFINQGLPNEGRRGSLEFDVRYYLAHYSDLSAAFGTNYLAAANHFLNQGLPVEGRQGSSDFYVQDYLILYPDVSAGYGATNYQQATLHWLRRGIGFGRSGTGAPQVSSDCKTPGLANRIYFADPAHFSGTFGDGSSESSPMSGGAVTRPNQTVIPNNLDYQLRCRVEGGTDCTNDNIQMHTNDLIVCLEPGDYKTDGQYDFLIPNIRTAGTQLGFTLGQNWKFHGYGMNATFMHLNSYLPSSVPDQRGFPPGTGFNVMFGTHRDDWGGAEVSDLTIDLNYPTLKGSSSTPLNLLAVNLRSNQGGHKIHHINVLHAAGEIALQDERFEAFPVRITSVNTSPDASGNNFIQWVLMSSFAPGRYTAINVDSVAAEVSFNVVNGGENTFGGFSMPLVWFHDNTSFNNSGNGFITDSLVNRNVLIQFNRFTPGGHGILIGGGGTYDNFQLQYNSIDLSSITANADQLPAGILFQGNVIGASVINNTITSSVSSSITKGIRFSGQGNGSNQFQYNQVSSLVGNNPVPVGNCAFNNWNQVGSPLTTFPNTQSTPCVTPTAQVPLISSQFDVLTNHLDVYYLGGDSGIHQLFRDSANHWHAFDLSFETQAPHVAGGVTSLFDTIHNTPQVQSLGTFGKVYSQYFDTVQGAWKLFDISGQTGATPASLNPGQLISLIDQLTNRPEIYYVGSDQHIHELASNALTNWQHFDVSAGAPNADFFGGLTGIVDRTFTNSLQLFYVGSDFHVHQISIGPGGSGTFDISDYLGAPDAQPGPGLVSLVNPFFGGSLEVYYLGNDGHIHELAWKPQLGWYTFDLNQITGAPAASLTAGLTAVVDTLNSFVEVFYAGADHHVHELGLATNGWFTTDLNTVPGAANASAGTGLSSIIHASNSSLEVYYGGADSHVHQFMWKAGIGWTTLDVNAAVVP